MQCAEELSVWFEFYFLYRVILKRIVPFDRWRTLFFGIWNYELPLSLYLGAFPLLLLSSFLCMFRCFCQFFTSSSFGLLLLLLLLAFLAHTGPSACISVSVSVLNHPLQIGILQTRSNQNITGIEVVGLLVEWMDGFDGWIYVCVSVPVIHCICCGYHQYIYSRCMDPKNRLVYQFPVLDFIVERTKYIFLSLKGVHFPMYYFNYNSPTQLNL